MNITKSGLAIMLSQLETFRLPSIKAEQYSTDSESAAELLWFAHMHRNIEDKVIGDLGAGTGILGLGALMLGAKRVYFVENCRSALKTAHSNLEHLEKIFISNPSCRIATAFLFCAEYTKIYTRFIEYIDQ